MEILLRPQLMEGYYSYSMWYLEFAFVEQWLEKLECWFTNNFKGERLVLYNVNLDNRDPWTELVRNFKILLSLSLFLKSGPRRSSTDRPWSVDLLLTQSIFENSVCTSWNSIVFGYIGLWIRYSVLHSFCLYLLQSLMDSQIGTILKLFIFPWLRSPLLDLVI